MKLQNQVVSLELAKKLKDLKVKQKSYFYHLMQNGGSGRLVKSLQVGNELKPGTGGVLVSAFTVAELGEMLKELTNHTSYTCLFSDIGEWFWEWKDFGGYENTEADARASILVYLIENNLITL